MTSKTILTQPTYNSAGWNTPLNANFGVISDALGTIVSVAVTTGNVLLTSTQAQAMGLSVTGMLAGAYSLRFPSNTVGTWVLTNNTTGSFSLSVYVDNGSGGNAGAGVLPPSGTPIIIFSDGTDVKLANDYFSGALPAGTIIPFGGSAAPTGYLSCDGSAVSRTTYAALFAAIGTTWGAGNGSTTFNLPDLQGGFLRGSGAGLNPAPRTVGSYEADTFKSHTHAATVTDNGHTHTYTPPVTTTTLNGSLAVNPAAVGTSTNTGSSKTNITVSNAATGGTETVPKNYAVLHCIKY